jgi:hypothetical protein
MCWGLFYVQEFRKVRNSQGPFAVLVLRGAKISDFSEFLYVGAYHGAHHQGAREGLGLGFWFRRGKMEQTTGSIIREQESSSVCVCVCVCKQCVCVYASIKLSVYLSVYT